MRPSRPGGSARSYHGKPALTREQIARRVAALLSDGAAVNLGAGLPALVANFLRERAVILHSENGMLNYGEFVHGSSFDPDLHDASGHFVTVRDGASFFDSVTSFEIARSGRLDAVVLGAYQVGANGDLANWSVPGMTGGGIGGAMDLAVGRGRSSRCASTPIRRVSRSWSVPATSRSPRRAAWTQWSPISRCCAGPGPGFRLEEIARGFSPDEVIGLTRMNVDVTRHVGIMQESWGE
jgi:3-oxoacid CoA-transferase